jgi:pimeloyl-ACP methyl ester carboxylesterase
MARSISNSEFVEFKKSGHVPFLEETEEFAAQMRRFLRGG